MDFLKNIQLVGKMIFGAGSFDRLDGILTEKRSDSCMVFLVDDFFQGRDLADRIPVRNQDRVLFVNVDVEPKTTVVDDLRDRILQLNGRAPDGVIGIGGGSVMDYAKAVAVMLTNPGPSSKYQGLNLAKNASVYHVGIPTLSGTGAEVSTTAVLTGPEKKLGIKGEFTPFHQIVLDPQLIDDVPRNQWFYTGMDSYIHNIESLTGHYANTLGNAMARQSLHLCREVFSNGDPTDLASNEKLMVASLLGGLSLGFSEVGACHAFSYGLSFVLGTRHGIANCIAFNQLGDYYPEGVAEFKQLVARLGIDIPAGVTKGLSEAQMDKMIDTTLALEHMWRHALGEGWKDRITRDKVREIYQRM
ncbi:MAG: alcohol dehydrogenase [Deltaproteobacteria bacterium SG8_13]|nr:MAG: alcohol dehydrogenase [Deltaproteobacteria bacterium SG8_13]